LRVEDVAVGLGGLHPTPYTLHHTLHPTPYTLHPTPYTLHPSPYTIPYTLHPTPYDPLGSAPCESKMWQLGSQAWFMRETCSSTLKRLFSPSGDEMPSLNKFERNTRTARATAAPCEGHDRIVLPQLCVDGLPYGLPYGLPGGRRRSLGDGLPGGRRDAQLEQV